MNLGSLIDSKGALTRFIEFPLSIKESNSLAKFINKVEAEFKTFEESKTKRIKELGTISEDGTQYIVSDPESQVKFYNEINELLSQEVEIVIPRIIINYDELEKYDIKISTKDLIMLQKLFGGDNI